MPERRVYIVRHGIAEDRSSSGRDADRALTREGKKKMKHAARGFAALGAKPKLILTSPLVRARETADILLAALPGAKLSVVEALASGADPVEVAAASDYRSPQGDVVLVGHEPDLSALLAFCLTGKPSGFHTRFRKGAVACLQAGALPPHGRATLEWLMTSDQLAAIAIV
jgi:phosphohistidine phosphatase